MEESFARKGDGVVVVGAGGVWDVCEAVGKAFSPALE